ncbi:hypothetical protein ACK1CN_00035 [Vibrio coralliilyticus]|uniref:hypothetical protein n=1 Tax=Vibrio coralliilyticus TaxID=190893 RepID=UPI003917658D
MNITSAEVKELTAWLHQDVDESIEDCGSLHLFKKYKRIYECLGLLQEILELDEKPVIMRAFLMMEQRKQPSN